MSLYDEDYCACLEEEFDAISLGRRKDICRGVLGALDGIAIRIRLYRFQPEVFLCYQRVSYCDAHHRFLWVSASSAAAAGVVDASASTSSSAAAASGVVDASASTSTSSSSIRGSGRLPPPPPPPQQQQQHG